MYNSIFIAVRNRLLKIGKSTGLSYQEVNIIVYFFLIPFSWACLLDVIYGSYLFVLAIFVIGGIVLSITPKQIDALFEKCVNLLAYLNRFGLNYERVSVWICVWLPLVIYIILIKLAFF